MNSAGLVYLWLGNVLTGAAVGVLGLTARPYFAAAMDFVQRDLNDKLRRMRAPTHALRAYLWVWLVAIGLTLVGFWFVLDNLVFAVLIAGLLLAAPWYLVRRMAQRRQRKIEDQMADAMVTLASAVKAGLSLAQALEILATQCPRPISTEFQQMVGEYKMGKPMERALVEAKERLRSENFALFAAAMLASHESGGRLNETVERIAQSVLELQRLERKVIAETAQARRSAVYMAIAPAFILLVYSFLDPVNTKAMFTNVVGQVMLGTSLVLNIVAYLWARLILNPDI